MAHRCLDDTSGARFWCDGFFGSRIEMKVQKCVWGNHCSPAAVRLSCHHCSPAAVRQLSSLFLQTTRLTERPATASTCTTTLYTCHTALRVPFPRPVAIPGRRESCRESSCKLRPPIQHAISLQSQCAWRTSSRETTMCRYLEELFYRSTIYLSVLESVRPCARPTQRPPTPSTCLSISPKHVTATTFDLLNI